MRSAYGTERADTAGVCGGDGQPALGWTSTGIAWGRAIVALADGTAFGRATPGRSGAMIRGARLHDWRRAISLRNFVTTEVEQRVMPCPAARFGPHPNPSPNVLSGRGWPGGPGEAS